MEVVEDTNEATINVELAFLVVCLEKTYDGDESGYENFSREQEKIGKPLELLKLLWRLKRL